MLSPRTVLPSVLVPLVLWWPAAAGAAEWGLPDAGEVSRGVFLRAAVQALDLPLSRDTAALPYRRVARGFAPYVRTAHERGALHIFGRDLELGRFITRGQALQILVRLQGLTAKGETDFRDVRDGTAEAVAVEIAVERGWMDPLRTQAFGAGRLLSAPEAERLLKKVVGRAGNTRMNTTPPPEIQPIPRTIHIRLGPQRPAGVRLPKADILETVWQIINQDFLYDERIDPDAASYEAIEGMVKSLNDPYSSFLRPVRAESFRNQLSGEVTGIGAQVEDRDGVLTIVTPLRGSPAERAGLRPGDQILSVDGVSLSGLGFVEAVDKVRGPKGSIAKLRIRRDGNEFDVSVTRDTVVLPEIEITWQEGVAVVRLMQFGQLTDTRLEGELRKVQERNPKGVILDLRNNPGGLLHAANVVVGNFVPKGTPVAKITSRSDERMDVTEREPTIDPSVPMMVLVNGGSASAAEITAAALQDAGRAKVIGEKTFGKGTVQEVLQFQDGSSLKLTIAEWFAPKGRKIDGVGVQPDVVVPYDSARDMQMVRALELLRR